MNSIYPSQSSLTTALKVSRVVLPALRALPWYADLPLIGNVLETKRQTTVIERFNRANISYKCHIPLEKTLKDKWCLPNSLNITWDAGQGKRNRETSVAQVSSEFSTVVKIQLCTAQGCFYLNGLNAAYFPLLMGRLILPS